MFNVTRKKVWRLLLSAVMTLCFLMSASPKASATSTATTGYTFTDNGIFYDAVAGTSNASVAYNNPKYSGDIVIPPTASDGKNTYTVTGIREMAFYTCSGLTSVKIGGNVSNIGDSAFQYCGGLESVTIPDNVKTIGMNAFSDCVKLTRIKIGSGVTGIGGRAFGGNTSLKTITIPDGVITMESSMLAGCNCLSSVTIGSGITNIPLAWCVNCISLGSVTIPDNVQSIGRSAFADCYNLTSVTLGEGLKTMEESAFNGCSRIESVKINEGMREIGDSAFMGCKRLKKVIIPNSVKKIGEKTFYRDLNYINSDIIVYCEKGSYAQAYAEDHQMKKVLTDLSQFYRKTAVPTKSLVKVNGKNVPLQAYNIGGSNYFKLRDLAYALNGTAKQFQVEWDNANNAIAITSGTPYKKIGGELSPLGSSKNMTATKSGMTVYVDDKNANMVVYNIAGSSYFKLRDIAEALDFNVKLESGTNTILIDTGKGYSA